MSLKILPVFGRDEEKETVKLFIKHAGAIENMAKPLQEAVDLSFGKKKDFKLVAVLFQVESATLSFSCLRYLSKRNGINSSIIFIPSVSFANWAKPVKSILRFLSVMGDTFRDSV